MQGDTLGHCNKVTVNHRKKDYPPNNIHFVDQFESLEELRKCEDACTDCKVCGAEIDKETNIYTDTIPPTCTDCKRKDEVTKAL